jgi:hypothetical protein
MAWRPWYQPHSPHTMWGTLADPQRGQLLRGGASSVQLLARRIRVFDLDFFFLGTATAALSRFLLQDL